MHWLLTRVCCLVIHGWETRPWWMTLLAKQSINIKQTSTKLFIFSFSEFVRPHIFRLQIFSVRPCLWFPPVGCPSSICPGLQGGGEYISRRGFYQQCSYTQKYKSTDKHPNTFSFLFQLVKMQQFCDFLSAAGQVFAESRSKREPQGWFVPKVFQGFPMFPKVFQGF